MFVERANPPSRGPQKAAPVAAPSCQFVRPRESAEEHHLDEQASQVVIELAKTFVDALQRIAPTWNRAFMRLDASDQDIGAKGSYVSATGVSLLGALDHKQLYEAMLRLGSQLRQATSNNGRQFVVCLVVIDSNFDYEVKFEFDDPNKWEITKLDGASGIPIGIAVAAPSGVALHEAASRGRKPWYKLW